MGRCSTTRVEHVELLTDRAAAAASALTEPAGALARLAVGDEHGLAVPGVDRGNRIAELEHPGTTPDRRVVGPFREDSELATHVGHLEVAGGDAVDVRSSQPGVGECIGRRIEEQTHRRRVGDGADLIGFGCADDCEVTGFHGCSPRARSRGRWSRRSRRRSPAPPCRAGALRASGGNQRSRR